MRTMLGTAVMTTRIIAWAFLCLIVLLLYVSIAAIEPTPSARSLAHELLVQEPLLRATSAYVA
jgi:hypothetical protein